MSAVSKCFWLIFAVNFGNAVPTPANSAIRHSQASESTFVGTQVPFQGRKGSFIYGNATSQSEFGQDNCLTGNTEGPLQNWNGFRDFYHSHYTTTLKLHFYPWLKQQNRPVYLLIMQ